MCKIAFNIIVAIIAFTLGFTYFILSLVPFLPPPNGFLVHWQNHKDFWAEGLDLSIPTPPLMTEIRSHHDPSNTAAFVSVPHPSAWHPSSSSNAYMDYSKYQQQQQPNPFAAQKGNENTKKYVIY
jgi:hypothetical protein